MSENLVWSGVGIEVKRADEEGRELGNLTAALVKAIETIRQDGALLNVSRELRHAFEDLRDAYELALPLFNFARLPIGRRAEVAGSYGQLLARLMLAEGALVGALARARSEWLFKAEADGRD